MGAKKKYVRRHALRPKSPGRWGRLNSREREKKKKKKYLRFPHKLPAEIGFAPTFFESLANNGLTLVSKMPTLVL